MKTQGDAARIPEKPADRDLQSVRKRVQSYGRVTTDPANPIDGWQWIRADLDPPVLRTKINGTLWCIPFQACEDDMLLGHFWQYATPDGEGTVAARDAIADYSGTAVEFKVDVPSDEIWEFVRMTISIASSGAFNADKYGGLTALTNGVRILVKNSDGSTKYALDGGAGIIQNADWTQQCFDQDDINIQGTDYFRCWRYTFLRDLDQPMKVDGSAGEYFALLMQDDLSSLLRHRFLIRGNRLAA